VAQNLTAQTARGIKWTGIATIVHTILQIGYTTIMARLLSPSSFGVVATGLVVLNFASYFSYLGMSKALIQKKDLSNDEIRAAFTSNFILGLFFFLLFQITAPLAIYVNKDPQIVNVIRVISLAVLIESSAATALSLIRRNLKFKTLAIRSMISYIIAYVGIGISLAYFGFGLWSLVIAYVSQTFINGVLAYVMVRHSVLLTFNWQHYKSLFEFGTKITVIGFLEFLGHSIDTLIIGRLSGSATLGLYNRAAFLINLPLQHITTSLTQVLFPSLSKIQNDRERLRRVYLSAISLISIVICPLSVGISLAAEPIVLVMLGEKWQAAIPVLQILAISAFFRFTSHFGGVVCNATASLNQKLRLQTSYILVMIFLFYIFKDWGVSGFATAILLAEIFKNIGYIFVLKGIIYYQYIELFKAYKNSLFTTLVVGTFIYLSVWVAKTLVLIPILGFGLAVVSGGLGLGLAFIMPFNRAIRVEIMDKLSKITGKKAPKTALKTGN
jgi:lipopolysaccharide exporter